MKCKYCNKELTGKRRKFCSTKCSDKNYYENNKEKYKKNAKMWGERNKERYRELSRKANKKYMKLHRERFNKHILNQYYKNKDKWHSRSRIYKMLKAKNKKIDLKKVCKKCGSSKNVRLRFEQYPIKTKDIIKAVKDKKIYYLCEGCR